ncbi:hypothetical protein [Candidatus Palauibacter sp.]|uniref:hypothetical protein n=1 Tax=Candidatus Palauibacter sp. TaxID=3101350 RepID=UPI003B522379
MLGFALAACADEGEVVSPVLDNGAWAVQAVASAMDDLKPGEYAAVQKKSRTVDTYPMGEGPFAIQHLDADNIVKDMSDPVFREFMRASLTGVSADGDDPDCAISASDYDDAEAVAGWNGCVQGLMADDDCATVTLEYIKKEKMYHADCLA